MVQADIVHFRLNSEIYLRDKNGLDYKKKNLKRELQLSNLFLEDQYFLFNLTNGISAVSYS